VLSLEFEFRREGDVKFSAIVEYRDAQTAEVAVRNLNGYKFQNRDLKVKLCNSSSQRTEFKLC
jgi:RNA recognition motif-containing protein